MNHYIKNAVRLSILLGTLSLLNMTSCLGDDVSTETKKTNSNSVVVKLLESKTLAQLLGDDRAAAALAINDLKTARQLLWEKYKTEQKADNARQKEHREKVIQFSGSQMKYDYKVVGKKPKGGYSLYIALHGGGGAPKRLNDSQWNHMKIYYQRSVKQGIYLAPRGISNTWNLHFQGNSYVMYDRLIENMVLFEEVNPNRVYILGFSAGGDGVYRIATMMSDRWAAANMSAGHPGSVNPVNLFNVPFLIQVGERDSAYGRNREGAKFGIRLDKLQAKHTDGYVHETYIHYGKPHNFYDNHPREIKQKVIADSKDWLKNKNRKTVEVNTNAITWLSKKKRNPQPKRVIWDYHSRANRSGVDPKQKQNLFASPHRSDYHYWIGKTLKGTNKSDVKTFEVHLDQASNSIVVDKIGDSLNLLLNEQMLDLDKKVTVVVEGQKMNVTVKPTLKRMIQTLIDRGDVNYIFPVEILIKKDNAGKWLVVEHKTSALTTALNKAGKNKAELQKALAAAPQTEKLGMRFIIENMPPQDLKTISAKLLLENSKYAHLAWNRSPWKKEISQKLFFNNILPYVNVNERRDNWRKDFYTRFKPLIKNAKTPAEAAVILNQKIFPMLKVRYSRKRLKADQSPYETIQHSTASCTGLSILLVDACRAVGVPARFAGTALWSDRSGNHSWVEIWDNGWHFTGAAEPTGNRLDSGWFTARAAKAKRDHRYHAIYAVSYKRTPQSFPLVWAQHNQNVYAVNVTSRYTKKIEKLPKGMIRAMFVVFDRSGSKRISATLKITDAKGKIVLDAKTNDERFDGNDHTSAIIAKDGEYKVEVRYQSQLQIKTIKAKEMGQLFKFRLQ